MTGDDPGEGRRSRVLLAIEHEANREQLAAWLSERHAVETVGDRPVDEALARCDLCLVDGASFPATREALTAGKEAARPVFLPSLLVLTEGTPENLDDDAWAAVDDVIVIPVRQAELRHRIEALLRARRYSVELERRNDRLERFADIVSHDLRNPLTVAQGSLQLAREGDASHLERADEALTRMGEIIDDVLTLARTGTVVEEPEPVDPADVAETAWRTVATGRATLDVAAEDSMVVHADETRLVELFENLFRNAVEHSSTGSHAPRDDAAEHSSTSPRSQAREDAVEHGSTGNQTSPDDAGDGVRIEVGPLDDADGFYVADDGPGIPAEERETVFEYGYTTADDGTGFGLAIVGGIVEAHGWSIRVGATDGGGARFEIATDHGVAPTDAADGHQ